MAAHKQVSEELNTPMTGVTIGFMAGQHRKVSRIGCGCFCMVIPKPLPWRAGIKPGPRHQTTEPEVEAYRQKAKAAHPDRPGGSTEAMARLNEARAAVGMILAEAFWP